MVELPLNLPSLVVGDDYYRNDGPQTDAADTSSVPVNSKTLDSQNDSMYLTPVSQATQTIDAPPLGGFLRTNVHDDYWCDPLKPHISPESQKG